MLNKTKIASVYGFVLAHAKLYASAVMVRFAKLTGIKSYTPLDNGYNNTTTGCSFFR